MPFAQPSAEEVAEFKVRFTKDIPIEDRPTLVRALMRFDLKTQPEYVTSKGLLELFRLMFDQEGPYGTAKAMHVLKNGSGEDLAIEFMGLYNQVFGTTY